MRHVPRQRRGGRTLSEGLLQSPLLRMCPEPGRRTEDLQLWEHRDRWHVRQGGTGLGYLPLFALATVLAGGVIAVVSLVARPNRTMAMLAMGGKGDWGRGIPYGVAIAIGAAVVMWGSIGGYVQPYRFGKTGPAQVTSGELGKALAATLPGR